MFYEYKEVRYCTQKSEKGNNEYHLNSAGCPIAQEMLVEMRPRNVFDTIEISSMISNVFPLSSFPMSFAAFAEITPPDAIPRCANLWMVFPPIREAAMPVNATFATACP
jgi:hypothetical protein